MAQSTVKVFRGLGLSPGSAEATVHTARSLEDLDELEDGQVLVVTQSSPAWTIGMLRASGFICEQGGVICHAAIVARELELPCVVDIPGIVEQLTSGTRVRLEVRGPEGVVHVLE